MSKRLQTLLIASEGMELRQVRVKYPRETFFSKEDRKAVFEPGEFTHSFAADEHHSRQKLTLAFTLPRGCYATILIIWGRLSSPNR